MEPIRRLRRLSALSYYRQILRRPRSVRRLTATPPVPTLLVTGADDGCIDTRMYDGHTIDVRRMTGAGHWVHRERPDEFYDLALDWLGRH